MNIKKIAPPNLAYISLFKITFDFIYPFKASSREATKLLYHFSRFSLKIRNFKMQTNIKYNGQKTRTRTRSSERQTLTFRAPMAVSMTKMTKKQVIIHESLAMSIAISSNLLLKI